MLLHVGCEFFCMSLFECVDSLIICLEVSQLLFVFLDASVEATLELFDLASEICNFGLVVLVKRLLLSR